ncbi:MAG TPA: phenylalanine--tRNA ligase beta subunit-related protein [Ktedonobacterales bacterium]|nr:phenylalanine--tRNA ligase beta subunit-related protein [Ktedonobacterales bacterium]
MNEFEYRIEKSVFERFPGYVRGVVLAWEVTNGASPDELVAQLRAAESHLRTRLTLEDLTKHPQILAWREAYRKFGAKPSEYRSSIEALARRVLREQPVPSINRLVDIGSLVSLRHLVPTGSHAIDVVTQQLSLRPATGTEDFIPFGEDQVEHPLPGEIIFVEGETVLTRRWTWRQAEHTLIAAATHALEFNIDGLPPVTVEQVQEICGEVGDLVKKYCGGTIGCEMLTEQHPAIWFSPLSPPTVAQSLQTPS